METKLIKESLIEFERGQKPKDTLKVGSGPVQYLPMIKKLLDSLGIEYKERDHTGNWNARLDEFSDKYLGIWQIYLWKKDYSESEPAGWEFNNDNNIMLNPIPALIEKLDAANDLLARDIDLAQRQKVQLDTKLKGLENFLDNINIETGKLTNLHESVDFKRGADPKDTLGVGEGAFRHIPAFEKILNDLKYQFKRTEEFEGDMISYSINTKTDRKYVTVYVVKKGVLRDEREFGWRIFKTTKFNVWSSSPLSSTPFEFLADFLEEDISDTYDTVLDLKERIKDYNKQLKDAEELISAYEIVKKELING